MGKIMAKILGQDAVEFGRNNPCRLDLGHDLDQDHGQDFFAGDLVPFPRSGPGACHQCGEFGHCVATSAATYPYEYEWNIAV